MVGWSEKNHRCVELEVDAEQIRRDLTGLAREAPGDALSKARRAGIPTKDPSIPAVGRWAAVVLEGDETEARRALAPLLRAREPVAFAGAAGRGLLVIQRPDTDTNTDRWIKRLREAAGETMPYNLLLVGGPDRFPFDVQRSLDQAFRTGRLDAGGPDGKLDWQGCAAYAEKAARHHAGTTEVSPHALLYSFAVDAPTREAHADLSTPLWNYLAEPRGREGWRIATNTPRELFQERATTAALTEALQETRPAVVFTMSHGIEDPVDPARWGALTDVNCVGAAGSALSAPSLSEGKPFAEGAVFFAFGCFSAGVPTTSIFAPASADGTRPAINGGAMTAPLARALLAHPRGPVAFIGHVDRVTNRCFSDGLFGSGLQPFRDFFDWTLGGNGTLGQGISSLHELGAKTLTGLMRHASPFAQRHRPRNDGGAELIELWQRYYDYSGFLLLGDPAIEVRARG
jgi:hypothetical protein